MTTSTQVDELLSQADVVDELGPPITKRTLEEWRYKGKGPAYVKVGKHVRYRRSDIERWLDRHTVRPEAA